MIFVDTGYLVALVRASDSLHSRAMSWAKVVRPPLLVTEYVLWEVLNMLSAPTIRGQAYALVKQVQNSSAYAVLPATPELFREGLTRYSQRPDKEWALTDCISFVVMEQRGIAEALAYDHHFEQAGFVALLRRDP